MKGVLLGRVLVSWMWKGHLVWEQFSEGIQVTCFFKHIMNIFGNMLCQMMVTMKPLTVLYRRLHFFSGRCFTQNLKCLCLLPTHTWTTKRLGTFASGGFQNFLWWGPERFHLTNPLQRTRYGQGNCVASGQMRGFLKKHRQMCLSCSNHHLHVDCSGFWNFKACIGNSWYFHMSPRALSVAGLQLLAVDRSGEPKAFVPADFGGRGASGDLAVAGRGSGQGGQRRHGSADLQGATRELPDVATGIYCGCWGIYRWLPGDIMMIDGIWVDGGMDGIGWAVCKCWGTDVWWYSRGLLAYYMYLHVPWWFWDAKVRFALLPCVWPEVLITSTSPWTSPSWTSASGGGSPSSGARRSSIRPTPSIAATPTAAPCDVWRGLCATAPQGRGWCQGSEAPLMKATGWCRSWAEAPWNWKDCIRWTTRRMAGWFAASMLHVLEMLWRSWRSEMAIDRHDKSCVACAGASRAFLEDVADVHQKGSKS